MASSSLSSSLSEDQFQCSICLDVFTDPVTTPCGHNFCKTCITGYWDSSDRCLCPMCKNAFERRPDLKVNTLFSEMAAQVNKLASVEDETKPPERSHLVESGDVPCDVCTEKGVKALKSCLVCLASFCESHLQPHQILASFKSHNLIDPVENLEDRVCKKHKRPLELFCKNDKMCVCFLCTFSDHKTHTTVPIEDECEERKVELGNTESQVQHMIRERQQRVQKIRNSVDLGERSTSEIIKAAEKTQKALEKQADEIIKELEEEINMLLSRSSELKILSHTEDQLHLLESSAALCTLPTTTQTLPGRKLQFDRGPMEAVRRAVENMQKTLSETLEEMGVITVRQYAVDVSLDPDTAHPRLLLSEDRRQVRWGDAQQALSCNPKRFERFAGVLGKEGFVSGRFYYEVEVTGNTWMIGVATESINRKSNVPFNPDNGVWSVGLYSGVYEARADPDVTLSLTERLQTLGVFVDYEARDVSFYNADTGANIYSFSRCPFDEKLYPFFFTGDRKPMTLRRVSQTD